MKSLIVANWKMNPKTLTEAKRLFNAVKEGIKNACPELSRRVEIVICPPFPYLSIINNQLSSIKIGAQNCHWQRKGAFTGEVSPSMLKDVGCEYVILGHSERRIYFGETNEVINKKLKAVLKSQLKPLLCVGENFEERQKNETKQVLEVQLHKGLMGIAKHHLNKIIIAYEPVWAISTFEGKPINPDEVFTDILLIRKIVSKIFDQKIAQKLKILYGGSVKASNAKDFLCGGGAQGLLVGGASLSATEFIGIVKNLSKKEEKL